jgi:hypothetical protein
MLTERELQISPIVNESVLHNTKVRPVPTPSPVIISITMSLLAALGICSSEDIGDSPIPKLTIYLPPTSPIAQPYTALSSPLLPSPTHLTKPPTLIHRPNLYFFHHRL